MKKTTKNILIGIGVILLYLLNGLFVTVPLDVLEIDYTKWSVTAKIIYNLLYELFIIFIIFMIYKNEMIKDFKEANKNKEKLFLKYIKYWFLLLLLMYISSAIIMFFTKGAIANNEQEVRELMNKSPFYIFVLSVIYAPMLEELVFRKSIRKIFSNDIIFIIVSGLIFGSMHIVGNVKVFTDILYVIPYSIPGMIFAYVYTKSNNIFVPIGMHFIHNGTLVTLQLLMKLL